MLRPIFFVAVAMLLAQCAPAFAADCIQDFVNGAPPAAAVVSERLCFTSYAVGYAPGWGEPAWSAEHLTKGQAEAGKATKRFGSFHAEAQLPAAERVSPRVYAKTGFDLGHMTPAGDVGADKPETFSTANMAPQKPNLNRRIWAGIEEAVRELAIDDGELYVVTGPLIPQDPERLGGKVSVPSHTWKAVYDPSQGAGAYICQNTDAPVCSEESVTALVEQIGFDPFPALPPDLKAAAIKLPEPTKGGHLAN